MRRSATHGAERTTDGPNYLGELNSAWLQCADHPQSSRATQRTTNSLIIDAASAAGGNFSPSCTLNNTNQLLSDEVWFEPVSGNYFLPNGSSIPTQQLGIASSVTLPPVHNAFVGFPGYNDPQVPFGCWLGWPRRWGGRECVCCICPHFPDWRCRDRGWISPARFALTRRLTL